MNFNDQPTYKDAIKQVVIALITSILWKWVS